MDISEVVVKETAEALNITRERRRKIQAMSKQELQMYLTQIYKYGFVDGANACEKAVEEVKETEEAVEVDWEDVLSVIASVKGIGNTLLQEIDRKLRATF